MLLPISWMVITDDFNTGLSAVIDVFVTNLFTWLKYIRLL